MKRLTIAVPFLLFAATPLALAAPSISAPGETAGVLERVVMLPDVSAERPLPRPARVAAPGVDEAADAAVVSGETTETAPFAPPSPFEARLISGMYVLPAAIDADLIQRVARGEVQDRDDYALASAAPTAFRAPEPEPERIRVAVGYEADPSDAMERLIIQSLEGAYDTHSQDGESGYDRLLSLAESGGEVPPAAMISQDVYQPPAAEDQESMSSDPFLVPTVNNFAATTMESAGTIMGMDPAAALLNSLSSEQVAVMSPDQITALVMAAQGRPLDIRAAVPTQAAPAYAAMPAHQAGIPSLDYRGESLPAPQVISAADVPPGSMPFSDISAGAAAAPEPVRVGDGSNLLLKDWRLGLTGSGAIGMYIAGDPGSIIEIGEGMVIGALGRVESLTMENGNIIARFSSGEMMSSPAALVNMASL